MRAAKKPATRPPVLPITTGRLYRKTMNYVDTRKDCMIAAAGYKALSVIVARRLTAVSTVNEGGFQPYTQQREIVVPALVILAFARPDRTERAWFKRFAALGGRVVTVHRLEDAMEALNG